jgi:hypothetical protein
VVVSATELAHPTSAHAHSDTITFQQSAVGANNVAIEGDGTGGAFGLYGTTDSGDAVVGGVLIGGTGNGVVGVAQRGIGVAGSSIGGYGVSGRSDAAFGVFGRSTQDVGVWGETTNGNAGVVGKAGAGTTGNGVSGNADLGHGVAGVSSSWVGGVFVGPAANVWLQGHVGNGAPNTGTHYHGLIYADQSATLWVCIADGTPGTWVRLTGVGSGTQGGAISYLSTPVRLLDARTSPGTALVTRGPLAANEVYDFTVAGLGGSGIPSNAQGLIGNVTILGPSGAGNLSLFPSGGAIPSVASMTFGTPGLFLANGVNVAIGSGGAINIQNQSSGTTPLVLDAVAYVS